MLDGSREPACGTVRLPWGSTGGESSAFRCSGLVRCCACRGPKGWGASCWWLEAALTLSGSALLCWACWTSRSRGSGCSSCSFSPFGLGIQAVFCPGGALRRSVRPGGLVLRSAGAGKQQLPRLSCSGCSGCSQPPAAGLGGLAPGTGRRPSLLLGVQIARAKGCAELSLTSALPASF